MRGTKDGIRVRTIPGPHTVFFGFDVTEEERKGLLGFSFGKRDAQSDEIRSMRGFKFFEETLINPQPDFSQQKM